MKCFLCGMFSGNTKKLLFHLKTIHNVSDGSKITCVVNSCMRDFKTFNSFRKHCKIHENNDTPNDNVRYTSADERQTQVV